jgi:circadian clock protein KaiC
MTESNTITDKPRLERVPSGIAGLDRILNGGFLKGGIYIVQGMPGVGKTIFGNQLCYTHTAAGGKALYVTLLAESHARMLMHMREFSFFDASRLPNALYYISAFQPLEDGGLKGLLDALRREVNAHGATVLVLDGLVAAEERAASDAELKRFIHGLQTAASLVDCTMFLLTSARSQFVSPEQTMVDGLIELTDQLQIGWRAERRLEIKKFRGSDALRGRHAYQITNGGIKVFPRLESRYAHPTEDRDGQGLRVSTGLVELDRMLHGGLPGGSTTFLVGASGTGKTALGLHLLGGCSAAEPGLLLGFYEGPRRLLAKSDGFSLGLRSLVQSGAVEILWQPATEGVLDELGERLLEAVRRRGVRRVFIDGLAGLEQATAEPERIRRFCIALATELRELGVTSLYTAQAEVPVSVEPGTPPTGGISLREVSSLADNIVLMRFVELRSVLHRVISILKLRDSGFDHGLREFDITDAGIVIDETPERAEAILAELAGSRRNGAEARTQRQGQSP